MSPSWITHAADVLSLLSASTGVLLRGTFAYHYTTCILCLDKLKEIFNENSHARLNTAAVSETCW